MDSISLRIHTPKNVFGEYDYHGEIVRALHFSSEANLGLVRNEHDFFSYSVPIMANEMTMMPFDYMVKQYHFTQSDKKVDQIKGRFKIPSSHYNIGYYVDLDKEIVDIGFSIPKYLYGHSVAQFVSNPHPTKNTNNFHGHDFDQVTKDWFNMFVKVIKEFFRNVFHEVEINFDLVDVIKIDLAFNQYFETKEQAVAVAELMGKKSVSSLRGQKGRQEYKTDQYSTGFASIHKNIYYKIYHKGTEFRKNDFKVLQKYNDNLMKQINNSKQHYTKLEIKKMFSDRAYKVDSIQADADLILRHEIRFFAKHLSYHFKRYVFRDKCPEYQQKKSRFRFLERKRLRYRNSEFDSQFAFTDSEKLEHKDLKSILDKRHSFSLGAHAVVKDHMKENSGFHENHFKTLHFSRELFEYMRNKFKEIILECQLVDLPTTENIIIKVDSHNAVAEKWNKFELIPSKRMPIISPKAILTAHDHILNYGSIEEAYRLKKYSKSTYYRIMTHLKIIGYTSVSLLTPIKTSTSFDIYFDRLRGMQGEAPTYSSLFNKTPLKYHSNF